MSETNQDIRDFFEGFKDYDFTEHTLRKKKDQLEAEDSFTYDHGDIGDWFMDYSEEDEPLAGPVMYADDTIYDPRVWYPSSEGEDFDGMATPPPPLSSSSDSGNDEPAISIEELEEERREEMNTLVDWLNDLAEE